VSARSRRRTAAPFAPLILARATDRAGVVQHDDPRFPTAADVEEPARAPAARHEKPRLGRARRGQ
jgi:hypothetical protein